MSMIPYRESKINAHHNYLVNGMLTPGFVVGDPNSEKGFYFLADVLSSGENAPRISARITDDQGVVLLELERNRILRNQGGYAVQSVQGGFRIQQPSGQPLFEVFTYTFPRGYLTRINGRLTDEKGRLRMEPLGESIRVHGEAELILDSPFAFST